jgi:hypothetical protein
MPQHTLIKLHFFVKLSVLYCGSKMTVVNVNRYIKLIIQRNVIILFFFNNSFRSSYILNTHSPEKVEKRTRVGVILFTHKDALESSPEIMKSQGTSCTSRPSISIDYRQVLTRAISRMLADQYSWEIGVSRSSFKI